MKVVCSGLISAALLLSSLPVSPANAAEAVTFQVISERLVLAKGDIKSAVVAQDRGRPVIKITLGAAAARKFADITRRNVSKRFQIVVGDRIVSSPVIQLPIPGPDVMIVGGFTKAEAQKIADQLR